MENTLSAADNPQLANELVAKAMQGTPQVTAGVSAEVESAPLPPDTTIQLSAGLIDLENESIVMTAEVRELNGADEEALARISDPGKVLMTTLERGTLTIGDKRATPQMLDALLAGDRELLLIEIRKATFGNDIELHGDCPKCGATDRVFAIDLAKDVEVKRLDNPIEDRVFSVDCKVGEVRVAMPNGKTQKKLIDNSDKTIAELDSILLKDCVVQINGLPIMDMKQVLNLSIKDRRAIIKKIGEMAPGPQLGDIKKSCDACGQEVPLPLTVADLFRL